MICSRQIIKFKHGLRRKCLFLSSVGHAKFSRLQRLLFRSFQWCNLFQSLTMLEMNPRKVMSAWLASLSPGHSIAACQSLVSIVSIVPIIQSQSETTKSNVSLLSMLQLLPVNQTPTAEAAKSTISLVSIIA